MTNKKLSDPTAEFYKAIRRDTQIRGLKLAIKFFNDCGWDDDVIRVTGEALGDLMACKVMGGIGNSLFDIPMQAES